MTNQVPEELNPPRENWFVFLYPASFGLSLLNGLSVIALARLTVIDQKLTFKELADFFSGCQLTPQQVFKIAPSKILFLPVALSIPFLLIFTLVPILAFDATIPTTELSTFLPAVLLILISPTVFFKCFKIKYQKPSYTGHLYFCCLRNQSSSIVDALPRRGFGDKLKP